MNALQKIGKRAKQLRQVNKKLSQTEAIKKAAAEYRAGKLGKVPAKKPLNSMVPVIKSATVKGARAHQGRVNRKPAANTLNVAKIAAT